MLRLEKQRCRGRRIDCGCLLEFSDLGLKLEFLGENEGYRTARKRDAVDVYLESSGQQLLF